MEKVVQTLKVTDESREAYQRCADASQLTRNLWICTVLDQASGTSGETPKGFRVAKKKKQERSYQRSADVSRGANISFWPTKKSVERWQLAAERANLTLREWMRVVLDQAAGVTALSHHLDRVVTT